MLRSLLKLRGVLSKTLKEVRKQRSLSQDALAHVACIERSYLSELEKQVSRQARRIGEVAPPSLPVHKSCPQWKILLGADLRQSI
ncbi:helix-turn-helix domain-containing protein [Hyphomonas sp. CACIAM 19H1]|uniref:helix-turn-helix domain-containing protein n=1 Tax=Hyphomonas sp. CACIAM 19H1 TaxID=1873716 RepID=UPI00351AAFBA